MTRDEAMRAVVEAARRVSAVGRFEDRVALRGTLDRLDAIPGEPGLPAICEYCGEVKAWNGEAWVGHCHEAPAPEQKTVRVMYCLPDCPRCGGNGKERTAAAFRLCPCVRAIDIPVGEVSQ